MALWGHGRGGHGRGDGAEPRLTRAERKELRVRQAQEAELAVRVARAQRRLAQASGPLPVVEPRPAPDLVEADQPVARRSAIVEH